VVIGLNDGAIQLNTLHYITLLMVVAATALSAQARQYETSFFSITAQNNPFVNINLEPSRLHSFKVVGEGISEQASASVVSAAPPITLFYNSQQKPKAWTNQQGLAQGFAFDVAAAVLNQAKIKFIAKGVPFNRGLERTKKCDGLMTGVFKTKERQKSLSYSLPIVPDKAVLITRADSSFEYKKMSDLSGKLIVYLRGAAFGNEFEQAVNKLTTVTAQDPATMLKLLLKGRVEVAILNPGRATVEYAAQDAGIAMEQFKIASTPLAQVDNYLVFCNKNFLKNQPMLQRINSAITTLKHHGQIDKIMASY